MPDPKKDPNRPIVMRTRMKELFVFLRSGEVEFLPGNRKRITVQPAVAQFNRGVCVLGPEKWQKLGMTREQLLDQLVDLQKKQGLFVIDEASPIPTPAASPTP